MTPVIERVVPMETGTAVDSLRAIYRIEPWLATAALVAVAPMLLVIAAIVAMLARRTPLVRHRRVGWRGAELPVLKLRTMWEPNQKWAYLFAIEDVSNTIPTTKNGEDDRVTSRLAAWCRKHSIDELPQLYHIVRGEMSFVGPRPITRGELEEHYGDSIETVLSLRPGLTGLWQMMGRSRLTYAERRRLDLILARGASPGLYFRILISSVPKVLWGHDAH
jgi:lipopolysaccharide/colanic/teichoic acid biosynthesis glycosyltransferase